MILMIVIIIVLLLLQTPKILQKAFWEQFMKLFFKFLEDLTKLFNCRRKPEHYAIPALSFKTFLNFPHFLCNIADPTF